MQRELWGAGTAPLGGKVSKPLPNPSTSLVSLSPNNFSLKSEATKPQ